MEKFHQYCLSVLLVIVCSNISGQVTDESIKSENCTEIHGQFVNYKGETPREFSLKEKSTRRSLTGYKQKAIDLVGHFFSGKHQSSSYYKNLAAVFYRKDKNHKLLEDFERQGRHKAFAANIYFKRKVAKIRNKDYLDLKNGFEVS